MAVTTRKADARARLVLPDDFANETIVIERISASELRLRKKKSLVELVAAITPENLHGEWNTGPDVGKEVP
jgi:antitoxin component of MazEF toxin-antitoxin module